jgi:hypothetical protein
MERIRFPTDNFEVAASRALLICLLAVLPAALAQNQQKTSTADNRDQLIQEQYAKHDAKIRNLLPPYSAMPLVLDLFHKSVEDGMCDPERHLQWEAHFDGTMGARVADLGIREPNDATGTTFTTIDTFAPTYSLPAKGCSLIAIATPISGRVCISQSGHTVYTKYTLQISNEFRKRTKKDQRETETKKQVTAVEFGGTIRFPSGYVETYLLNHSGFMEIGKSYVLFLSSPIPSDPTFVEVQGYLIQDGLVFPIASDGDAQTVYTKMPFAEFEAKIKEAVKRNVDADVFPNVHASSH